MNKVFTKKELRRIHLRWVFHSQLCWNYERMQGLGYLTTMVPVIEKLYGDRPKLRQKALDTHNVFFNTQPVMGDIIVGINVAVEEHESITGDGIDMAASLKLSLMGPFAGIGNTVFGMLAGAVFGSIAASMAVEGNIVGTVLWFLWNIFVFFLRFRLFDIGYSYGVKLVTTLTSKKDAIIEASSVIGLIVVGGMIATMIKFPLASITGSKIGVDENGNDILQIFNLQEYADSIMPALMPACIAGLFYLLLGKKWMNSNRLIMLVIVGSIGLTVLGVVQ